MWLDGIRILDLSRLLPGPYATQLLADMGAEVIKVEHPDGGDPARTTEAANDIAGGHFSALNRGKKSVVLDLKTDGGREAFLRIASEVDVVLEQFRPGVVDRLGIGYEDVCERNPDVIYCSLSGFGATGPYRDRVGHDLNYVALAGMLDMNRPDENAKPTLPALQLADMSGGLFAALGITSALASRELGNEGGDRIDLSMTDAVVSLAQPLLSSAFAGENPRPGETHLTGLYPCYDVYPTADGRHVTFAALERKFFVNFCAAVEREDLIEAHMSPDREVREALRSELRSIFESRSLDEWESDLGDSEVMVAPVKRLEETLADPHVEARGLVESNGPERVVNPITRSDGLDESDSSRPALGEHTEAVLSRCGYDEEAIRELTGTE